MAYPKEIPETGKWTRILATNSKEEAERRLRNLKPEFNKVVIVEPKISGIEKYHVFLKEVPKTELNREERHELCKILKRYISESPYERFMKEGFRVVVDNYEAYGRPDDLKEFKTLKDLIDEAIGDTCELYIGDTHEL